MGRQTVITGIGAATTLGVGSAEIWSAIRDGRSGLSPLADERLAALIAGPAGLVDIPRSEHKRWFDPRVLRQSTMTQGTLLSTIAAAEALSHGGLEAEGEDERAGAYCGVFIQPPDFQKSTRTAAILARRGEGGGWAIDDGALGAAAKSQSGFEFLKNLPNMAGSHVAIRAQFMGPSNTYLGTDASGLQAVHAAVREIEAGSADAMLAGGVAAPLAEVFLAWQVRQGRYAPHGADVPASRQLGTGPGALPGEAAVFLLIESEERAAARGARVLARVTGSATTLVLPDDADPVAERVSCMERAWGAEGRPDLAVPSLSGVADEERDECATWEAFAAGQQLAGLVTVGQLGNMGPATGPLGVALAAMAMGPAGLPMPRGIDGDAPGLDLQGRRGTGIGTALVTAGGTDGSYTAVALAAPESA